MSACDRDKGDKLAVGRADAKALWAASRDEVRSKGSDMLTEIEAEIGQGTSAAAVNGGRCRQDLRNLTALVEASLNLA